MEEQTTIAAGQSTAAQLDTAEQIVRQTLAEDERARNSDLWLILSVWQRRQHIRLYIPYDKLQEMISPETIRRVRQRIQNTLGEFPPTDDAVKRRRMQREREVRKWVIDNKEEKI